MAGRLLIHTLRKAKVPSQTRGTATVPDKIGAREIVGYGYNGEATYMDREDYPMPAIRFKEETPDIIALREKEKGDWKKLSIEEKKALYRASFCQTFAEMNAPHGEWKGTLGVTLLGASLALWMFMFFKVAVYPPLPESFSEEHQRAQLKRMLLLDINPITGISSHKHK